MTCEPSNLSNIFDHQRASFRTEYDGDNLIYLGHAIAGKAEDDRAWAIQKFTYIDKKIDRNWFPSDGLGGSHYNYKWSERSNYNYV